MRLFEPLARLSRRAGEDYAKAAEAGIAAVVEAAAPHGPPRLNAGTFEDAFGALLRWEPSRAAAAGLEHFCALGLPGREAGEPSVTAAVLWLLPRLLEKENVVALGEIGLHEGTPQEEEAFSRQLEIARLRSLPVIVRLPPGAGARGLERHLALIAESGLTCDAAVIVGADEPQLGGIRDAGCWGCLRIGAGGFPAEEAAVLRRRWGVERLMLSGDADGCGGDLFAVPVAAAALLAADEAPAVVERLLWDNPRRFFALDRREAEVR